MRSTRAAGCADPLIEEARVTITPLPELLWDLGKRNPMGTVASGVVAGEYEESHGSVLLSDRGELLENKKRFENLDFEPWCSGPHVPNALGNYRRSLRSLPLYVPALDEDRQMGRIR